MSMSSRAERARPVTDTRGDSIPTHLVCKSCSELLFNCMQTHHGIRLCQPCVNSKLHPTTASLCPGSADEHDASERMASQATCYPDTATRRELSELPVNCPNADTGCPEQFKLKLVDLHLNEKCEFEIVSCHLCSGGVTKYKLLLCHRNLQSEVCCPSFHAYCPFCRDTSRSLSRADFVEHLKTCPECEARCKYECVGCKGKMKRSQLGEHYRCCTDDHLESLLATVKQLQLENQKKDEAQKNMQQLIENLQIQVHDLEKKGAQANDTQFVDDLNIRLRQLENSNQELALEMGLLKRNDASLLKMEPTQTTRPRVARHSRHLSLFTDAQLHQLGLAIAAATDADREAAVLPTDTNRVARQHVNEGAKDLTRVLPLDNSAATRPSPARARVIQQGRHRRTRSSPLWVWNTACHVLSEKVEAVPNQEVLSLSSAGACNL